MAETGGNREQWISDVLDGGLQNKIYTPADLVTDFDSKVLAKHLPREVLASLLQLAMGSGKLSPDTLLGAAPTRLLSKHIPYELQWKVVSGAAEKLGLPNAGKELEASKAKPARAFLHIAIDSGLKNHVYSTAKLLQHLDATVLVNSLPHELTAKILDASLKTGTLSPDQLLAVVGLPAICEHGPAHLLWAAVVEISGQGAGSSATKAASAKAKVPLAAPAEEAEPAAAKPAAGKKAKASKAEKLEEDAGKAIDRAIEVVENMEVETIDAAEELGEFDSDRPDSTTNVEELIVATDEDDETQEKRGFFSRRKRG